MKTSVKIIMILLLAAIPLTAATAQQYDLKMNLGNIGYAWNHPDDNSLEIDILNIGIENIYTGIGVEISPIKFWNRITYDTSLYSLLNFGFYWNAPWFRNPDNGLNFNIALVSKINYIFAGDNNIFDWNEYVFSAGLRLGLVSNFYEGIQYSILNGEFGYRLVSGRSTYYVSINMDMAILFIFYLAIL